MVNALHRYVNYDDHLFIGLTQHSTGLCTSVGCGNLIFEVWPSTIILSVNVTSGSVHVADRVNWTKWLIKRITTRCQVLAYT